MKRSLLLFIAFFMTLGLMQAQILNDFDSNENLDFFGWPNWPGKVLNPSATGINTSDSCASWQRTGETWAHVYATTSGTFDFSVNNTFKVKVYAPYACNVLMKFEDQSGAVSPIEVMDTVHNANQWEQLEYNFSAATSGVYDKMIFFFDFATNNDTVFYFDDVEQVAGAVVLNQIDLPVDFESTTTDYTLTDFGGNSSALGVDPANASNTVAITSKTSGAQTWAGTTIGTNNGFASPIPFTALEKSLSVKVYSPAAGTVIRLKVEDHTNNTITCETEATTTVANAWETLVFDFGNPVSGTAALDLANTYDMASIFFDFGNSGTGDVYYWDDVMFVPFNYQQISLPIDFENDSVDYTFEVWGGTASELAADPTDPNNTVAKTTKPAGAATWSGTAPVGNANGLNADIPFDVIHTYMKLDVYSPAAGIPILFKVEDKNNGSHSCETLGQTTVANAWETIVFDMSNNQPNTPALNLSWNYNKVALFFGFGNTGAGEVFYWENVNFIDTPVVVPNMLIINDFDENENVAFEGWPNWPGKVLNPNQSGINTTDTCAMWQRTGETWAHVYAFPGTLDFSTFNTVVLNGMAPYPCNVLCKLEDQSGANPPVEIMDSITVANQWQELSYNFSWATSGVYDKLIFFFDFATNNDTAFYFDEVRMEEGPIQLLQIDLPIDFEATNVDYTVIDFGGNSTVLGLDPVDPNNTVAITTKTVGAATWAGTTASTEDGLASVVPFTAMDTKLSMRVYSPAAGIPILFKLEEHATAANNVETTSYTTVANAWETIEFDFSNENPGTSPLNLSLNYDKPVIFFNFGAGGNGEVFYWDDIQFVPFVYQPVSLPIDFENDSVDYTFEIWGGTYSELAVDPADPNNTVAKTTKGVGAEWWSGTGCVGNANGLVTDIPFTANETQMSVRIYSPAAGIPILLKVEDKNDGSHSCETLDTTSVANAWETIIFDFANNQPGTPALDLNWNYNKVSLFFGFGNVGAGEIFYWDDVDFVVNTTTTQTLSIVSGWSIFSTYIDPDQPSMDSIFAPIVSNVVIVKNGNGLVYWPTFSLNSIGNIVIGEGYQINVASAQTLGITGTQIVPESTPITIPAGWSIMGYLRNTPANIETMMSPIVSDILIMKNGNGFVYWPTFSINAIGNMNPGEGYQINLINQNTYTFPANGPANTSKSSVAVPMFYQTDMNTGSNMTICIPKSAWENTPAIGDEIAAFNQAGQICGSAVYEGANTAICVWGSDSYQLSNGGLEQGENLRLSIYNPNSGSQKNLVIENWEKGSSAFTKNAINIAGNVQFDAEFSVQAYPNPVHESCILEIQNEDNSLVQAALYSVTGQLIQTIKLGYLNAGLNRYEMDLSTLPAGMYYFRISGSVDTQIVYIQKL